MLVIRFKMMSWSFRLNPVNLDPSAFFLQFLVYRSVELALIGSHFHFEI